MASVEEQIKKKRPFKKKEFRSYLGIDETVDDLGTDFNHRSHEFGKTIDQNNPEQTGDKSVTNREQTGDKSVTNREQTGDKSVTNREQTGDKLAAETAKKTETGNKLVSESVTLLVTNREQTGNKLVTKPMFSSLVGLQRTLLIFLYDACKIARGRSTEALTVEHIGFCLKTNTGSVKTTIRRLEVKGYLLRIEFKIGRGGWSKYELPEAIFREMLQLETSNKLVTNREQTGNKLVSESDTEPVTSLPSSSSISELENFKTTTTGADNFDRELPSEWKEIDCTPLQDLGITFGESQLKQIFEQGKISVGNVQLSIQGFAFDLKHNDKRKAIRTDPLRFIVGMLRKGMPYALPENYESQEDRALREFIESQTRYREKQKRLKAQALEEKFQSWKIDLSPEQLRSYLSPSLQRVSLESPAAEACLREYFRSQVLPSFEVQQAENEVEAEELRARLDQELGALPSGGSRQVEVSHKTDLTSN